MGMYVFIVGISFCLHGQRGSLELGLEAGKQTLCLEDKAAMCQVSIKLK